MADKQKILLVDDEPDVHDFIGFNLKNAGYEVVSALSGRSALEMAKEERPDLVIVDIDMPEMDGIEVCKTLRTSGFDDTIITFLTACSEAYTEIAAFEAGGDDFIKKPIQKKAFLLRINALLKRLNKHKKVSKPYIFGDLIVNPLGMTLEKKGRKIQLPKKQFEILLILISNPESVFSRKEIFEKIWPNESTTSERVIDVYIRNIRKKVGKKRIQTIKGVGYKFHA